MLLGALEVESNALFAEARKAGMRDAPATYRADALVNLATGRSGDAAAILDSATGSTQASSGDAKGSAGIARPTVCIRVDATALRRGYAEEGEICHIPGVGPIPVAVVNRQLSDAFVKVLLTDGVDVTTVCHPGRTVTARVQSALEERDPTCVVPGCDIAHGLENHHWDELYADCRTTSLAGLARVCHWHHDLLSYHGYTLTRDTGCWGMRAPPDVRFLDFDTG